MLGVGCILMEIHHLRLDVSCLDPTLMVFRCILSYITISVYLYVDLLLHFREITSFGREMRLDVCQLTFGGPTET